MVRGAWTLDYIHPVLGRAGVGLEVTPIAELRVGGRGRRGVGEKVIELEIYF